MKLKDLNPQFVGHGGPGITNAITGEQVERREGVGLSCDCPCGCDSPLFVHFENPTDGGPAVETNAPKWKRTGDDFVTMTLRPSLQRVGGCEWHGYLTDGEFKEC